MSDSDDWTEYHLTPRGWERGSEKTPVDEISRQPPADRVQTIKVRDHLGSDSGTKTHTRETTWTTPDKGAAQLLLEEFGPAPDFA